MPIDVQTASNALSESTGTIEEYYDGIEELYPLYEHELFREEALGNWRKWEYTGAYNALREEDVYNQARRSLVRFAVESSGCIERLSAEVLRDILSRNPQMIPISRVKNLEYIKQEKIENYLSDCGIVRSSNTDYVDKGDFSDVRKTRNELVHDTHSGFDLTHVKSVPEYFRVTSDVLSFLTSHIYGHDLDFITDYLQKSKRNPFEEIAVEQWTLAQLVSRYQQYCGYLKNSDSFGSSGLNIEKFHEKTKDNVEKVEKIENQIRKRGYETTDALIFDLLSNYNIDQSKTMTINCRNIDSSDGNVPDDIHTGKRYTFTLNVELSSIDILQTKNIDGVHWSGLLGISEPSIHRHPLNYTITDVYPTNPDCTIGEVYSKIGGQIDADFEYIFDQPSHYLIQLMIRMELGDKTVFLVWKSFRNVRPQNR
jgi:hypothetical protein